MKIKETILLILTLTLLLKVNDCCAQKFSKQEIKAAYIHNFIRFVKWPTEKKTLTIGIIGKDNFTTVLISKLHNQKIGTATIKIINFKIDQDYTQSDVIYISNDRAVNYKDIIDKIKGKPILSIAEIELFCSNGGMINFVKGNNGNYLFEINQSNAEKNKIQISSKLLKLAIPIK